MICLKCFSMGLFQPETQCIPLFCGDCGALRPLQYAIVALDCTHRSHAEHGNERLCKKTKKMTFFSKFVTGSDKQGCYGVLNFE